MPLIANGKSIAANPKGATETALENYAESAQKTDDQSNDKSTKTEYVSLSSVLATDKLNVLLADNPKQETSIAAEHVKAKIEKRADRTVLTPMKKKLRTDDPDATEDGQANDEAAEVDTTNNEIMLPSGIWIVQWDTENRALPPGATIVHWEGKIETRSWI